MYSCILDTVLLGSNSNKLVRCVKVHVVRTDKIWRQGNGENIRYSYYEKAVLKINKHEKLTTMKYIAGWNER